MSSMRHMLVEFCEAAKLEWSIQDGVFQIFDEGRLLFSVKVVFR